MSLRLRVRWTELREGLVEESKHYTTLDPLPDVRGVISGGDSGGGLGGSAGQWFVAPRQVWSCLEKGNIRTFFVLVMNIFVVIIVVAVVGGKGAGVGAFGTSPLGANPSPFITVFFLSQIFC